MSAGFVHCSVTVTSFVTDKYFGGDTLIETMKILCFFVCLVGFFLAAPRGMQDPSSPTRDRTLAPCSGSAES